MDDARFVGVMEGRRDLAAQTGDFHEAQTAPGEPVAQVHAAYEIAHNVESVAFPTHLMHWHNVGMAQLGCGTRFAEELFDFRGGKTSFTRNLDRHKAIQFRVAGFPDGAEAAKPQARNQLETANRPQRRRFSRRFFAAHQTKTAATRRTANLLVRRVHENFDRAATKGATNLQAAQDGTAPDRRVVDCLGVFYCRRERFLLAVTLTHSESLARHDPLVAMASSVTRLRTLVECWSGPLPDVPARLQSKQPSRSARRATITQGRWNAAILLVAGKGLLAWRSRRLDSGFR